MAIQAMPHMISSVHHAVILRGRHLDDASAGGAKAAGFAEAYAAAKPAALAPPPLASTAALSSATGSPRTEALLHHVSVWDLSLSMP